MIKRRGAEAQRFLKFIYPLLLRFSALKMLKSDFYGISYFSKVIFFVRENSPAESL